MKQIQSGRLSEVNCTPSRLLSNDANDLYLLSVGQSSFLTVALNFCIIKVKGTYGGIGR